MRAATLSLTERPRPARSQAALSLLVAGASWPLETSLARLIRGLGDGGATVTVACTGEPDAHWFSAPRFNGLSLQPSPRFAAVPSIGRAWMAARAILRSPSDTWRFWRRESGATSLTRRLRAWYWLSSFAGRRWDVIYFPDPEAAFALPPLFELGCAVVVSAFDGQSRAGDLVSRLGVASGLPWIFTKATRVHCASDFVMRRLTEGGVDPDKVVVVPPGVDLEFFCPGPERPSRPEFRIVTTVGSGLSTQGVEHALLAVQRLKRASVPVRLEMIGDCVGEERHRVLYTIHDLDLLPDVHLHGALAADATRRVLRSSDVFVSVGMGEDVSQTALHAMACGVPVVTSESGATRETIAHGAEGLIVPAWNPEAMARALAGLWTDAVSRRRMGAAARRRVAITARMAADRLLALCRDAAGAVA